MSYQRGAQLPPEDEVRELYRRLTEGWNAGDAEARARPIAADGLVIGYDGSQMLGREEVASQLGEIFASHRPATYVAKVRSVRANSLRPSSPRNWRARASRCRGAPPPLRLQLLDQTGSLGANFSHNGASWKSRCRCSSAAD